MEFCTQLHTYPKQFHWPNAMIISTIKIYLPLSFTMKHASPYWKRKESNQSSHWRQKPGTIHANQAAKPQTCPMVRIPVPLQLFVKFFGGTTNWRVNAFTRRSGDLLWNRVLQLIHQLQSILKSKNLRIITLPKVHVTLIQYVNIESLILEGWCHTNCRFPSSKPLGNNVTRKHKSHWPNANLIEISVLMELFTFPIATHSALKIHAMSWISLSWPVNMFSCLPTYVEELLVAWIKELFTSLHGAMLRRPMPNLFEIRNMLTLAISST